MRSRTRTRPISLPEASVVSRLAAVATRLRLLISRPPMQNCLAHRPVGDKGEEPAHARADVRIWAKAVARPGWC